MYKYIRTGEEARRRFEGFAADSGIHDAKTQAGDSYLQVGPANLYGDMNLGNLASERLQVGIHNYEPGKEHDLHSHPTWEQFYYVISGKVRLEVGDEKRVVGPGGSAYIPAGVTHGFEAVGTERLVIILAGCILD